MSLPPATILSVPIYDFAMANDEVKNRHTEFYYPCCGERVCMGCMYSVYEEYGNFDKCPSCKTERKSNRTDEEKVEEMMKLAEANDASAINVLNSWYYCGHDGLQQDKEKGMELFARAAGLGSCRSHFHLGNIYNEGGVELERAKFHYEAAATAGHELALFKLGIMESKSGNMERAIKHWTIAASAGDYTSMHNLQKLFDQGHVGRSEIDSTLVAYNNSCAKMRSEARDAYIQFEIDEEDDDDSDVSDENGDSDEIYGEGDSDGDATETVDTDDDDIYVGNNDNSDDNDSYRSGDASMNYEDMKWSTLMRRKCK